MLRLFFQSLEQTFGSALSSVASLVYWGSLFVLAMALLVLLCRRWMELEARNFGIQQHWVMTCGSCGRQTIVTRRSCGYCDADLKIPGPLALWTGATRKGANRGVQRLTWMIHVLGTVLFITVSIWLLNTLGAVHPEGQLHRLFLGTTILAWVGLGWLSGRVLSVGRIGVLSRVKDGMTMLVSAGIFAISLILVSQASSVPETRLARFSTDDQWAHIGDQRVALPQGKIGFEYLQLDHDLVGYHRVISLAFVGKARVPTSSNVLVRTLAHHLHKHADAYAARGLTIRLRTDRVQVRPNQSYEIMDRGGQVLIRKEGHV